MRVPHADFQPHLLTDQIADGLFKFHRTVNAVTEHRIRTVSVQLVAVFIAERDVDAAERGGGKIQAKRIPVHRHRLGQNVTAAIRRKPGEKSVHTDGITAEIDVLMR